MKNRFLLLFLFLAFVFVVTAQPKAGKTFWKEDFTSGKLPDGWTSVALNDSTSTWFFTDQPFPGSPGRNYQAPQLRPRAADTTCKLLPE